MSRLAGASIRSRVISPTTVLAIVVVAVAVGAAAWAWTRRPVAWDGPVRVGFRSSPPFYYVSPDGRPQGMAVDVIRTAAERAGLPLAWVRLEDEESSIGAIESGRIDIWPSMLLTARSPAMHVTMPWLETVHFLVFRRGSGHSEPADVAGRVVALLRTGGQGDLVAATLPSVSPLFVSSSAEKLQVVCRGEAVAAFVEGREAQALLLQRPTGCESVPLEFLRVAGATTLYGVGARLAARAVADRLRDEIGVLSEDGTLATIHARWSFTTADEVRLIYALQQARTRGRLSTALAAALAVALLAAIWVVVRSRQAQHLSEAYAREQERYRRLFERNLAGVYRTTADGAILDCNDAFAHMLGCVSRADLLNRTAWEFYGERSARAALLDDLRRVGTVTNREQVFRRVDGRTATLLMSTSFVPGTGGEPDMLEGTAVDVTRERELEEQYRQAQKLESIGRLAGGVAHDFNNTLTAINGYAELVLTSLDPADPNYAMLLQVRKAGQHAESLTRQLLAFSRRQHLQPAIVNLNAVLIDTRSLLQRVIGEDIELITDLHPDLANVKADPGQLQQVLMNLAVNARDAMPDGGRLTLSTSNVDIRETDRLEPGLTPGRYCRLRVTDSGHGMDADTRGRIFEPFFTTKDRGKGTGLGLSTVYGIVKQSGGHIRVVSDVGAGTTFEIDLPAVGDPATGGEPGLPATALGGTETILVVEDQDDVRQLVCEALRRWGYTTIDAADGAAGVELCRNHAGPIDLLLTDVVMPGLTGPAVAEQCCTIRPALKVLFMSGYADGILKPGMGAARPGAFLQKPFTPVQLAMKVHETLRTAGDAGRT